MVRLLDPLIFRLLDRKARTLGQRFAAASERPWETQATRLLAQVRRERGTGFGRDHRFATITNVDAFRRQVPISSYDELRPYLDRVYQGETSALFSDARLRMFAMTSGTSAARKYIPVSDRFVEGHQLGWSLWALATYEGRQQLLFRDKFALVGDADESRSPADLPCGSISGLTARMLHPFVRRTYCLPAGVTDALATRQKYYLSWRIGLVRDVGSWVSPNPSTHLNLARFGDELKEALIRDVRNGTLTGVDQYPADVVSAVRSRLAPNRPRAQMLDRIVAQTGHLYPKDVWPNFGLIGCWLGGPLRAYLRFFPQYFGATPRRDLGLIASEARMTIPLHDETPAGALDLLGSFFEFLPVEEAESSQPTVLLPHELIEGRDYFIILTTESGLYRYNIQDVVKCVGWYGRNPLIEFQHKGKHFSNLTGEKLSEIQAARAVEAACLKFRTKPFPFALAPRFADGSPSYVVLLEPSRIDRPELLDALAARADQELCRLNCEYESKRASQRLGPLEIVRLPAGTWDRFDQQRLRETGGTPEQYKRPCLFPDLDFVETLCSFACLQYGQIASSA